MVLAETIAVDITDVKNYGATGNGVTDDSVAIAAADVAAAGGELWFPPGTYVIGSQTFGSDVQLRFSRGATLQVKVSETVTLHTRPDAGSYQIFDADDVVTGDVTYDDTATGAVANPIWWGAVADGNSDQTGTDSLAAFEQAYGALPTAGYGSVDGSAGELCIPPGNYHFSGEWVIGSSRTINAYGVLVDQTIRINGVGPLNLRGIKVVDSPGSGIIIDKAILMHARDIQVAGAGLHGLQLGVDGSGNARSYIDGLIISGCAGDGVHIEAGDEVATHQNALYFNAADIKGSFGHGVSITAESQGYGTSGIMFSGALIEGNFGSAIHCGSSVRTTQFYGGYLIGPIEFLSASPRSFIHGGHVNTATKTFTYENGTGRQPTQGEKFTGQTSGAAGRLYSLTVDSGTWAGGTAVGTMQLTYDSGDIVNPEQMLASGIADWKASKRYIVGATVNNDTGKVYICTTAGKTAASPATGPSGTGSGITDGSVVWDYSAPQTCDTTSLWTDVDGLNDAAGVAAGEFWDVSRIRMISYINGREQAIDTKLAMSGLGDTSGTTGHVVTCGGKDVFPITFGNTYPWMITVLLGGGGATFYPERAFSLRVEAIMDVERNTVKYSVASQAISEIRCTFQSLSLLEEIWYDTGDDGANNNGTPVVGDTVTGATSGATATIHAITVDSGTWAGANAIGKITLREITGTFRCHESVAIDGDTQLFDATSFGYKNANDQGGATPAVGEKVKQATLTYDTGNGTQPIAGETITSSVSGATATLASLTVDSGTWGGGTAAGTLTFSVLSDTTFVNADVLTFSGSAQTCNATEDGPVGTITSLTTEGGAWVDGDGSGIIVMDTLTGIFADNPTLIFSGSQQTAYMQVTSVPTAELAIRWDTDLTISKSRNASTWRVGLAS